MPVVKESNPLVRMPPEPKRGADIAPKEYKHAIVDSKKVPVDSLITYISGMSWVVDYYSQVLGEDEEPKAFSATMQPAYQSYDLIKRYELKLQSDLSSSFDDAQNRVTMSGNALTYPKLKPNKGDVIIGDMGDGRAGRFSVTEVSQKTIYNNTCYEINFELVAVMDSQTEALLQHKTIKRGHFVKDFITYGQNPVLVDDSYVLKQTIDAAIKEVLGSWLSEFYSYEIGSIKAPHCDCCLVYDPWVTSLMTKLFTINDHPLMGKINLYNCDAGLLRNYTSIWDAILSGHSWVLDTAFKDYQLISTQHFNRNIFLRNISTSKIDLVVMPWSITLNKDDPLFIGTIGVGKAYKKDMDCTLYDASKFKAEQMEVRSFVDDRGYVVSNSTYLLDSEPTTDLEQELRNYFQGETVDERVVLKHVEMRKYMSPLQRFYLMPLCLLMLTNNLRSL